MGRYSVTETIDAPADAVWAVLGDPTRAPEWMKTVAAVEKTSEGETAKGASFRAASSKRGRHGRTVTVTEWEAGRRIALASKSGGVSALYDYRCESGEEGKTQVTLGCYLRGQGLFLDARATDADLHDQIDRWRPAQTAQEAGRGAAAGARGRGRKAAGTGRRGVSLGRSRQRARGPAPARAPPMSGGPQSRPPRH